MTTEQGESPGVSTFYREGDDVFFTYSIFDRGGDIFKNFYNYLDITHLGRQEDQLDGHRGAGGVGQLAEQGQVELREAVAAPGPAVREDALPRPHHVRRPGVVAGQFEGKVRLDRDADLARPAGVVAPAAVGLLLAQQVVRRLAGPLAVLLAQVGEQQDVL